VSSPVDPVVVNGNQSTAHPVEVTRLGPPEHRDAWLRVEPEDVMTLPPAGQDGHGRTAFVRRQPVRIVDGRFQGGYTDMFELICPGCGDHPYLDYSEAPPRLQWLRGPHRLEAALAAYHQHIGQTWEQG
jgi:hypothetical protein